MYYFALLGFIPSLTVVYSLCSGKVDKAMALTFAKQEAIIGHALPTTVKRLSMLTNSIFLGSIALGFGSIGIWGLTNIINGVIR
jgi:hypothetical protein